MQDLAKKLQTLLVSFGQENGVAARVGRGSYDDVGGNIKVEFTDLTATGEAKSRLKDDFSKYAHLFGLKPEHLGKQFVAQGKQFVAQGTRFEIVGCKPQSPKFPVICKNLQTGKNFKFQTETIIPLLQKS